jgi:threonine dehydratase
LSEQQASKASTRRSLGDVTVVGTNTQQRCQLVHGRSLVDDIVTVSDAQLIDAMKFFAERMKIVVEPTGCLAAAAAMSGVVDCKGQRVDIVLSGGNVDLKSYGQLIGG